MEKCIHNLDKVNCFYCNGTYYDKREAKKKIAYENQEMKVKYEELKEKFRNFKELWTEDEIFVVYDTFKDLDKKQQKYLVFKTAINLERTKNAVVWMILHLFSERTDLHRGKEVEKFREIFKLKV